MNGRAIRIMVMGLAAAIVGSAVALSDWNHSPAQATLHHARAPKTARHAAAPFPPISVAGPAVFAPEPVVASVGEAVVAFYGDSLGSESESLLQDALLTAGVADVRTRTFGGTAICDWFDEMRDDAVELRPSVVVVEFSGNALTPCMMGPDGVSLLATRDVYFDKYARDAAEVLAIFSASPTRVVFVGAPISRRAEESRDPEANRLNRMYEGLALFTPDVTYVDAGAAVLRDGHWTETLPCLPSEPCLDADADGVPVNIVRAPDGGHFCPGAPEARRGVTQTCPVWSSGAYRFARAIADGVLVNLTRAGDRD